MATFLGLLWAFLIYELILFVVCYVVVDYGQNYLYDEVTPGAPAKVALGSAILAGILTYFRSNFATMFTAELPWTVGLAIVWAGVFILVFRFQPWHGFGLAMATLLLFAGLATLVVDSLLAPRSAANQIDTTAPVRPIPRRPIGGGPPPTTKPDAK